MPIALALPSTPALATYDDLIQAVMAWLKDATLEDSVPTMIALTESRLNRVLNDTEQEYTVTTTAEGSMSLPADFLGIRSIYIDGTPRRPLVPLSPDAMREKWAVDSASTPQNYTIEGGTLYLAPSGSGSLVMTYIRKLTALSTDNASNWLLESHPDVYLYGTLAHAEFFGWNDDRLPLIKAAWDEAIQELNDRAQRKRYGSALQMRASVSE